MSEKLKKILSLTVSGELKTPTDEQLKKQINNNLTIMSWMWLIMMVCLSAAMLIKDRNFRIFSLIASVFIMTFITSLHNSQKQNRIILEIRSLKENTHLVKVTEEK